MLLVDMNSQGAYQESALEKRVWCFGILLKPNIIVLTGPNKEMLHAQRLKPLKIRICKNVKQKKKAD